MQKVIKYGLCIISMFICLYLIYNHYEYQVVSDDNGKMKGNVDFLESVKKEYNNEIVLILEIPGVVKIPVVQTDDNTYYFTHDLNKEENALGTPFLDYRNASIFDKKLIIYGHNTISKGLDFANITNYKDENFFLNNQIINIHTDSEIRKYKVFSSFIDDFNSDSFALNDYNGLSFYEHITNIKNKSVYDTNVEIDKNSKVLLLANCAYKECSEGHSKYQFVAAVEDNE